MKVRETPCPFQHCCDNVSLGENGNCIVDFEDILECWAHNTDPSTLSEEDLKGYCAYHGLDVDEVKEGFNK